MKEQQALQIIWRLTVLLCVVEIGYGMAAGSLGLVSDGVHSFANCLGVGTSLFAMRYSASLLKTGSKSTFTYGVADRAEVLAAFANSVILMLLAAFLVSEALHSWLSEHSHHGDHSDHVAFVALGGILVNLIGLRLLSPHLQGLRGVFTKQTFTASSPSPRLLNLEAVALHLAFDVLTSLCVLASSVLRDATEINADNAMAVGIALLTVKSVNPMFQRTLRMLAQASAQQYDYKLRELASSVAGVLEFHQVHFWTLAPGKEVGSFIIRVRSDAEDEDAILKKAHGMFAKSLYSLTVQIQREMSSAVALNTATAARYDSDNEELPHGLQVRDAAHII
ncbi:hypothetical protein BASA81_004842 [Batrachochytrium salamandrivorans]|nr:hypothetical protein BASA81_004842 [Batrachochytrium salamandrivorans]